MAWRAHVSFACGVVSAALIVGCGGGGGGGAGSFVDPRDGHTYSRVTIGATTWMGENLDWQAPAGSFCYEDSAANCSTAYSSRNSVEMICAKLPLFGPYTST